MITKLRLHNWKSFEDSTIYIDPLTFLIGTNASGKSNVLDAFDFLRLDISGVTTENIVNQIRGGEEWIIRKGEDSAWLELTIEENGQEIIHKVVVSKDEVGLSRMSQTISSPHSVLDETFINYVVRDDKGNSHIKLLEEKENLAKLMASGNVGDLMVMDKL